MRSIDEILSDIELVKEGHFMSYDVVYRELQELEDEFIHTVVSNIPHNCLREMCEAYKDGRVKILPKESKGLSAEKLLDLMCEESKVV